MIHKSVGFSLRMISGSKYHGVFEDDDQDSVAGLRIARLIGASNIDPNMRVLEEASLVSGGRCWVCMDIEMIRTRRMGFKGVR